MDSTTYTDLFEAAPAAQVAADETGTSHHVRKERATGLLVVQPTTPVDGRRFLTVWGPAEPSDDLTPTEALARIAELESDLSDPAVIASEPDHLQAMREELAHLRLSVVPTVGRPVLERRKPAVTTTIEGIEVRTEIDEWPDLSWLEQTDDQMGEGFEAEAAARLAGFQAGEWHSVGVVATAVSDRGFTVAEASVWGVESDSDESFFATIIADLVAELGGQLGVDLSDVPVTHS